MAFRSVILPDDFTSLDKFFHVCETADAVDLDLHRRALQDQKVIDQFRVCLDDHNNQIQGFARLHFSEVEGLTEGRYWYYVLPTATDQTIGTSFLQWAEQQTLRQRTRNGHSRCRLSTGSRSDHPVRFQFLEANSFTRERYFFTMKTGLENIAKPRVPAGYRLRTPTSADLERYTDLHNLTFREHWNSPPISVDELRTEQLAPEYRPELDTLVVTEDDALVSFCTAIIEPGMGRRSGDEGMVGLISSLGTDPAHRGIGLGRALLLHTLRTLRDLSLELAYISVDAANATGAVRLYESVGFQTFETWLSYFKYL